RKGRPVSPSLPVVSPRAERNPSASRVSPTKSYPSATRNGCSSNGRAFHRDLDMLTPSLPLNRCLDLPVCLARFPSARLWLKDESLEDSEEHTARELRQRIGEQLMLN